MTPAPRDVDPEKRDPGLAHERTSLAWTRTALSFGALGGAVLKVNVITGLIILAIAPLVWEIGRISGSASSRAVSPAARVIRMRLITVSIVAVALLCLVVALFGHAVPGALR